MRRVSHVRGVEAFAFNDTPTFTESPTKRLAVPTLEVTPAEITSVVHLSSLVHPLSVSHSESLHRQSSFLRQSNRFLTQQQTSRAKVRV